MRMCLWWWWGGGDVLVVVERWGCAPAVVTPSWTSKVTVALTAGITLLLGAVPQPLLDLVNSSALFTR